MLCCCSRCANMPQQTMHICSPTTGMRWRASGSSRRHARCFRIIRIRPTGRWPGLCRCCLPTRRGLAQSSLATAPGTAALVENAWKCNLELVALLAHFCCMSRLFPPCRCIASEVSAHVHYSSRSGSFQFRQVAHACTPCSLMHMTTTAAPSLTALGIQHC